jgi:hypothetical protein
MIHKWKEYGMKSRSAVLTSFLVAGIILSTHPLAAQGTTSGSIRGLVTDPDGLMASQLPALQ